MFRFADAQGKPIGDVGTRPDGIPDYTNLKPLKRHQRAFTEKRLGLARRGETWLLYVLGTNRQDLLATYYGRAL